jgi:hypothetical protein
MPTNSRKSTDAPDSDFLPWRLLLLLVVASLGVGSTCAKEALAVDATQMAFVADSEERTFSEILQKNQRVLLYIELIDTARPKQRKTIDKLRGFLVPPGARRVQFRVVLPSMGLMDSRAREARGYFDVNLQPGHRYRVAGYYEGTIRRFHLLDLTTNEPVTPPLDLGFFGPVRREALFVPIIIPVK